MGMSSSQYLLTKAISLVLVPRNAGDVHVYSQGWCDTTLRWRAALGTLEFSYRAL